jgi:DNA-binding transcriptional MerR regulator
MRIGELAKSAGVTPDTIRYYEREGLLEPPPRGSNGYRDYGPDAVQDLRFIRNAQLLGMKLIDVRETLAIAAGGKQPCEHVRTTVAGRLADVERRLKELRALRSTLRETLQRLEDAPPPKAGCRCAVIEAGAVDG